MKLVKHFLSAIAVTAALAAFVSTASVTAPSEAADAVGLPHKQPAAAFPNTKDGLPILQLGVGSGLEEPFINVIKDSQVNWTASGGGAPNLETPALYLSGVLDQTTNYPQGIPSGYDRIAGMSFRDGARNVALQPHYAGTWVVEWDGDASLGFGRIDPRKVKISHPAKNRLEGAFPASGVKKADIQINRLGPARAGGQDSSEGPFGPGFSNLRIYRKENEAALKAGKLLTPDFRAYASRYKVLRTLDLQAVNINWQRTEAQFASVASPGWRPANFDKVKTGPRGFPPEPLFQMAMETDAALWMHFPGQAGAGEEFDADEIFKNADDGTTGDVKGALHSLASAKAREIIASPEWDKIAGRIADALIASGYPEDRRFYLELSNEVWNFGSPFWRTTHYFHGLGLAVAPAGMKGERFRIGYGYATARMAEAFEKALADRGRKQAWVPVIAGQNANDRRTMIALEGYKAYFAERGADPAPWLKIAGVSTASYYQNALSMKKGIVAAKAGETIEDAWLREIRADPDGLAKRVADFYIDGPASLQGTLAWVAAKRAQHQKIAEAYGAFFLGDYEGGDHDGGNPPAKLSKEPDYVNWVEGCRFGPEGERVTRAWIERLKAQNPQAVIANYYGVSAGDREPDATDTYLESPWADGFYTDVTGRGKALDDYQRKPL